MSIKRLKQIIENSKYLLLYNFSMLGIKCVTQFCSTKTEIWFVGLKWNLSQRLFGLIIIKDFMQPSFTRRVFTIQLLTDFDEFLFKSLLTSLFIFICHFSIFLSAFKLMRTLMHSPADVMWYWILWNWGTTVQKDVFSSSSFKVVWIFEQNSLWFFSKRNLDA